MTCSHRADDLLIEQVKCSYNNRAHDMLYIHFYKQLENFHILHIIIIMESNDEKPYKKITVNCKKKITTRDDCIQHSTQDGEL